MNERATPAGVSYFDVATAFAAVGRTHNGLVDCTFSLPVRPVRGVALDVRVRLRRRSGKGDDSWYERGVSGFFPSVQSRTLAGLLLRLAYELDQKLTEESDTTKRATQGRFAW